MTTEQVGTSAEEWYLGETLATPDSLYVLWLIYNGLGHDRSTIEAKISDPEPNENIVQELIEKGLIEQPSSQQLTLTDLGRQALSFIIPRARGSKKEAHRSRPSPLHKRIRIKQIRSPIGYGKSQKETLRGLGLKRINQTVSLKNTPEVRGMINRVPHLVRVLEHDEI